MKQFIEKLIDRFEEESHWEYSTFDEDGYFNDDAEEVICLYRATDIINQLAEEYNNDFCEWKFVKSVADGSYIFSSGCNHKRFSDLHSFEYCPYCAKKIKVVE